MKIKITARNRLRDDYNQTYFEVFPRNAKNIDEIYVFFTGKNRKKDNYIDANEVGLFYIRGCEVSRINEDIKKCSGVRKVNFDTLVLEIRSLS